MSYSQSVNHWKNHRKDRFVQQCSGYFGSQSDRKSLSDIADTEQRNSHSSMILILKNQRIFPFYIFQDNMGIWQSVPKNHISGHCINSMEELQEFAKEYAEIKEGEIPMIINHPVITESEDFHGFRTVHFYEIECAKVGHKTERIPCFSADGTEAIALLNRCPEPCSAGAYDGLDIITADEAHCLYSGATRHDGSDLEAVLSRAGFHLIQQPVISLLDPVPEFDDGQDDLVQLSLFT